VPIDFSLCGYSHIYFDISFVFGLKGHEEGKKRFLEGYRGVRNVEILPRHVEPYIALGVLLFITGQYERAKEWDWFPDAMERWNRDIFEPLADNKQYLHFT
jgi:hypothetical protein